MIHLNLYGNPIPWKRPGGTRIRYDIQAKEKEQIKWVLRSQYRNSEPLKTPLIVNLVFSFPVPKSASGIKRKQMLNNVTYHMKRPDVDNCAKFILDCMNGEIFQDDCQIVQLNARKQFSDQPGTLIELIPITFNQKFEDEDANNTRVP